MKSYLISDNLDTLVGMRLAGISGEVIQDASEIIQKVDELIADPDIGIIILTHKIKAMVDEAIMERKIITKKTLIVEIPGPGEPIQKDFITHYIRESIGLKI